MISDAEAERRGKFYDEAGCSYLFTLTKDSAVDSTYKGNEIRFANHSDTPNCIVRIMTVNGDNKIGIYAKIRIEAEEEITFDYGYDEIQRKKLFKKDPE